MGYLKIRYPANITADDPATNDWISAANPSAKEYTKQITSRIKTTIHSALISVGISIVIISGLVS